MSDTQPTTNTTSTTTPIEPTTKTTTEFASTQKQKFKLPIIPNMKSAASRIALERTQQLYAQGGYKQKLPKEVEAELVDLIAKNQPSRPGIFKPVRPPFRNPRTNPYGKYVTGFFNFQTELLPHNVLKRVSIPRWVTVLGPFSGILFGSYYLLNKYNAYFRYQREGAYWGLVNTSTTPQPGLNFPENTPLHSAEILPLQDCVCARPDMVFGGPKYQTSTDGYRRVFWERRNVEEKANSTIFQAGPEWNIHRYVMAQPQENFDAIRLKGLYNLAVAAHHEGRVPGIHLPLKVQARMEAIRRQRIV